MHRRDPHHRRQSIRFGNATSISYRGLQTRSIGAPPGAPEIRPASRNDTAGGAVAAGLPTREPMPPVR